MIHTRYIVEDEEEAIVFYCEHFGFELKQQFGSALAVITSNNFHLWLAGPSAYASKPMPDGSLQESGGWARILIGVADLDSKVKSLKKAGVTFRNEIVKGLGGRMILCEDPSGNAIELFESFSSPQ